MMCLFDVYLLVPWLHILYISHYTAWTLFGLIVPARKKKSDAVLQGTLF